MLVQRMINIYLIFVTVLYKLMSQIGKSLFFLPDRMSSTSVERDPFQP